MRQLIFATVAALSLLAAPAFAQSVESGVTAYEAGDYKTALANFAVMSASGDPAGDYWLGRLYAEGKGVEQNDAQAVGQYQRGA